MARYTGPVTKKSRRLKTDLVGGRNGYRVIEKQFRRYYAEAASRPGRTGETLLQILESRLDNVVYRAGPARTCSASRQLVTHGHFLVNGQRVDVPSYRVEQYDIITVRKQSDELFPFELARATFNDRPIPALDEGRAGIADDPDPHAPDAPADRFAGRRAADR